jgi:hypothetical protein
MARAEANLQLDEIMNKALTAYGGERNLAALTDNSAWVGEILFGGLDGHNYAYKQVRKGAQWRTDVESTSASGVSETKITAFDGDNLWQTTSEGPAYLKPEQAVVLTDDYARQPTLLTRWHQPGYTFTLVGSSTYHDVPAWQIEEKKNDGAANNIYLDKNSFLVLGITYSLVGDKTGVGEKQFSENRPALGTIYPFHQKETIESDTVYELSLSDVSIAESVPTSYFIKPGPKQQVRLSKSYLVPFDYGQKEIVCRGKVGGNDGLYFLFDTGSSDTIIDRRTAAQLLLVRGNPFRIAAFGGDISTQSTNIDRLELGNLIINDVNAKIMDLSGQSRQLGKNIAGIIGMNVISNFLVTIDYGKSTLTFEDSSSAPRPEDTAISFSHASTPTVKASLGGTDSQEFLMDTGAAFNHISNDVARKHLTKDGAVGHHQTEGTGLDGKPVQLGSVVIDPVVLGNLRVRKITFTYPINADTKKSDANLGILGNPFWQNFIVTIDGRFQRIILKPNPFAAIKGEFDSSINYGDNELITKRQFRTAEMSYQRALILADNAHDPRYQAIALGRLGNLRRVMAHDLQRPEHARASYNYFVKADDLARKSDLKDVEGRLLGDWSLLYSDNGQLQEAKQTIDKAMSLAPQDANVNVDSAVHLFRSHQYPEAQRYIEKALFLDPANWQALWYEVKLSEMFNDPAKEKQTLAEILRYFPSSKVAADKLRTVTQTQTPPTPTPAIGPTP